MKNSIKRIIAFSVLTSVLAGLVPVTSAQESVSYEPPRLEETNAWSLIVIPDTQSYVKFARYQGIYDLMTAWVADNIEPLNVLSVLHVGDLVQQNSILKPDGKTGDQTGDQQWDAISGAFESLDGKTPYIIATGNHDYGISKAESRDTQFIQYFPVERNKAWKGVLVECGPGFGGAGHSRMPPICWLCHRAASVLFSLWSLPPLMRCSHGLKM